MLDELDDDDTRVDKKLKKPKPKKKKKKKKATIVPEVSDVKK